MSMTSLPVPSPGVALVENEARAYAGLVPSVMEYSNGMVSSCHSSEDAISRVVAPATSFPLQSFVLGSGSW